MSADGHPCQVQDVLILVGGVNGGVEGPAGLYHHLHSLARRGGGDGGAPSAAHVDAHPVGARNASGSATASSASPTSASTSTARPSPPLLGWSLLSLNAGHTLDAAIPVIRAGIRWVLTHHATARGRIFLLGTPVDQLHGPHFVRVYILASLR